MEEIEKKELDDIVFEEKTPVCVTIGNLYILGTINSAFIYKNGANNLKVEINFKDISKFLNGDKEIIGKSSINFEEFEETIRIIKDERYPNCKLIKFSKGGA